MKERKKEQKQSFFNIQEISFTKTYVPGFFM